MLLCRKYRHTTRVPPLRLPYGGCQTFVFSPLPFVFFALPLLLFLSFRKVFYPLRVLSPNAPRRSCILRFRPSPSHPQPLPFSGFSLFLRRLAYYAGQNLILPLPRSP